MKRFLGLALASLLVAGVGVRLSQRAREERASRHTALILDWADLRDLAARTGASAESLITEAAEHGANGLLIPAMTLETLRNEGQLAVSGSAAWSTRQLKFHQTAMATQAAVELRRRGLADVSARPGGLLVRSRTTFETAKDIEVGFDPELTHLAQEAGLLPLFRLNRDPWTTPEQAIAALRDDSLEIPEGAGILFNSDEVPGGKDALPFWVSWVRRHNILVPFFEFHPSRAAIVMARHLPSHTFRSHTIPSSELKDLPATQEAFRWRRAALERNCRFLLLHGSPNDSLADYWQRLDTLRTQFNQEGWTLGIPQPRHFWDLFPRFHGTAYAALAFLVAVVGPWLALAVAWPSGSKAHGVWGPYLLLAVGILIVGSTVAALSESEWTRLQITPFRGIKAAFFFSWVGSVFILYRWTELDAELSKALRRWDVVFGLIAVALVGYALIRSGNAPGSWKPAGEQGLRNALEALFVVRPRFKEFAIGFPALWIGLWLKARHLQRFGDPRLWIAVGMIGPASVINTFCHLHSPIVLAFWRSANGMMVGAVLGWLATQGLQWFPKKVLR